MGQGLEWPPYLTEHNCMYIRCAKLMLPSIVRIKPLIFFHLPILALTALKSVVPGFSSARLRNFGMTIGTRDSRKIVGRYYSKLFPFFLNVRHYVI